MSFLDGLIRASLAGYTGYQSGRQAGEDLRLKREQEAADRQREATTAALRDALIQQQTEEAKARAARDSQPAAPKYSIQTGEDGTLYRVNEGTGEAMPIMYQGQAVRSRTAVRNIDPLSSEGITAAAKRAAQLARIAARYQRSPVAGAATTRTNQNDEIEGLTIGNTYLPEGTAKALADGFKAARAAGITLPPGRLMKQVYEGLKRTRPELFPKATTGSGGGDFGNLPDGASGATVPGLPPPVSTADELPLEPGMIQQARTLVQGSDDPTSDLAQSGFTPSQIKAILGQ